MRFTSVRFSLPLLTSYQITNKGKIMANSNGRIVRSDSRSLPLSLFRNLRSRLSSPLVPSAPRYGTPADL